MRLTAEVDAELSDQVLDVLRAVGLGPVGIADAAPFTETRAVLEQRRAEGLHAGMAFTYRNPERSTEPGRVVPGARSLVVGAYDYLRVAAPDATEGHLATARVARYAWADHYRVLTSALGVGAAVLRGAGYQAVVVADQNDLVDREAARRAGIGWYGHNANILAPGEGSWFVLGSIVTDAALRPSTPVGADGCGPCTACIDGCPTGAIVARGVVDARRCLAWLLQAPGTFPFEFREALGDRLYGCDECQEVCPPNITRARRRPPVAAEDAARPVVDVAAFLDDDDDAVLHAAGRWYVPERAARYLRRNALLVLGNAGDPGDPGVVAAVARALADPDPVVRGHAVWAAARLGRADLADALAATEADPVVRSELGRVAEVTPAGMTHLLVTNDFPPKVGGIQTYLGELWRRLPPAETVVLTAHHADSAAWDRAQPFTVRRLRDRVLLPRRSTAEAVREVAAQVGAKLVVLDPALPIGLIGPDLGLPYAVVLHGAEVTVPGRLPLSAPRLARVLRGARGIIAAGSYPRTEALRVVGGDVAAEVVEVPPGVDLERFRPLDAAGRAAARARLDLPAAGPLIVAASRLVPRKGFDVLIEAVPALVPHHFDLTVAIAGAGRDRRRLGTVAGRLGVAKRVRFLGRVSDDDLAALYGVGDVFAMLCRNRWGGLEQEGFGMVFMEAAACGVPSVAGASGGAADAVEDGRTGLVVDPPTDVAATTAALARLLDNPDERVAMGAAARARAEAHFGWDTLAADLRAALTRWTP